MIFIDANVAIPEDELSFAYSRSSGPGGQNVNKVETRVTLLFDLVASQSLNESQKRRIATKLETRVNNAGVLRVVCQRHRTRSANRREAVERFAELLAGALARRKPRKQTRVSKAARRRRLDSKRRRADLKKSRGRPGTDD